MDNLCLTAYEELEKGYDEKIQAHTSMAEAAAQAKLTVTAKKQEWIGKQTAEKDNEEEWKILIKSNQDILKMLQHDFKTQANEDMQKLNTINEVIGNIVVGG